MIESHAKLNVDVKPPVVKIRWVEKYHLRDLKTEFSIPSFQRQIYTSHIRRIVDAILQNKFYDIVIKYYVDSRKRKQVLDGQQRIEALYAAYELHGVYFYSLMFLEYEEKFARTAFRRLNMGRPLQTRDHSRALDDGRSEFFNELQPWLAHDRIPAKASYVSLLNCINYSKYGKPVSVSAVNLDTVVESITKKDIEFSKEFCEAYKRVAPRVSNSPLYGNAIYRNVFRICKEKNFDTLKIQEVLREILKSKKIMELRKVNNMQSIVLAYKLIYDQILPKVKK